MPFIGNTPAAVPLTSADIADGIITSAKIVDGTIVNADINASAAIASTKLSGVTSDYVLLSTTTASGTATTVDITSNINSTYSIYRFSFFNLSATGAGNTIFLRISDDAGATFKATNYKHTGLSMNYTGATITRNDEAATGFVIISTNLPNYNDSATEGACGFIEFYNPSVSRKAVFTGMTAQIDDAGDADIFYLGGVYTTAIIFNAVRIAASNNIYGTFKLYGIK